jgi:hypothetical protein
MQFVAAKPGVLHNIKSPASSGQKYTSLVIWGTRVNSSHISLELFLYSYKKAQQKCAYFSQKLAANMTRNYSDTLSYLNA